MAAAATARNVLYPFIHSYTYIYTKCSEYIVIDCGFSTWVKNAISLKHCNLENDNKLLSFKLRVKAHLLGTLKKQF